MERSLSVTCAFAPQTESTPCPRTERCRLAARVPIARLHGERLPAATEFLFVDGNRAQGHENDGGSGCLFIFPFGFEGALWSSLLAVWAGRHFGSRPACLGVSPGTLGRPREVWSASPARLCISRRREVALTFHFILMCCNLNLFLFLFVITLGRLSISEFNKPNSLFFG